MSRLIPILRTCKLAVKHSAPVTNSRIKIYKYPEVTNLTAFRKMSTVTDEILNEPGRNLDYKQLLQRKKDGKSVLIDVREHSEINETGKLPGSIHIPLNELKKALKDITPEEFLKKYKAQKPSQDSHLIFSCRSGRRSLNALKTALELGYNNAAHYKGGWLDWVKNSNN